VVDGAARERPDDVEDHLDRLVRRLRSFSPRAWRTGGRRETVRRLVDELVALGGSGRAAPDVREHALGDAVAVLAREAVEAGEADAVGALLRHALDATR
jgi:hypothetical protein